jgi:hypothetical protein
MSLFIVGMILIFFSLFGLLISHATGSTPMGWPCSPITRDDNPGLFSAVTSVLWALGIAGIVVVASAIFVKH